MKIQSINNNYQRVNNYKNTNFKAANKFCKYSILSLLASSSMFMLSNAIDTFKPEKANNVFTGTLNTAASVLTLAGTAMGLFGIEKIENEELDEKE